MNGLRKCAAIVSGWSLKQLDWDSKNDERIMLWSWNDTSLGSQYRHICTVYHQSVVHEANKNAHLIAKTQLADVWQMFRFVKIDSLAHPGFYLIKNEYEKCVSVKGNTNQTGAEIWNNDCNPSEAGQRWK